MKLLITGPIGSGKTTQAKIIAEQFGVKLVKTGDLVRAEAAKDTPEGHQLQQCLSTGHLAPDDIVIELVRRELADSTDFICDSYPRRISELEKFDPQFEHVIYLNISDQELEQRLLARQRADDKPKIIEQRLKVYHAETKPLLDHYQAMGKLIEIDGHGTIEEITQRIKSALQI